MTEASAGAPRAVFLGCASGDVHVAARICEALRAGGIEVWFDRAELVGGDAWDAKIKRQIQGCVLFFPVISRETERREEGYFRREWHVAVNRTLDMATDKAFLVPVLIDDLPDASARVPEKFREVHWTRLPGGETPKEFVTHLRTLLEGRGTVPAAAPAGPSRRQRRTVGWRWAAAGVALALFAARCATG
jgi:hypothetical protein